MTGQDDLIAYNMSSLSHMLFDIMLTSFWLIYYSTFISLENRSIVHLWIANKVFAKCHRKESRRNKPIFNLCLILLTLVFQLRCIWRTFSLSKATVLFNVFLVNSLSKPKDTLTKQFIEIYYSTIQVSFSSMHTNFVSNLMVSPSEVWVW